MCMFHGNGIDVFSVRRRRNLYCQSGGGGNSAGQWYKSPQGGEGGVSE